MIIEVSERFGLVVDLRTEARRSGGAGRPGWPWPSDASDTGASTRFEHGRTKNYFVG